MLTYLLMISALIAGGQMDNEDNDLCETCIARHINKKKPKCAQKEKFIPLSIMLEQWNLKMKKYNSSIILKEFEDVFKQQHIFYFDTQLTGCDIPMYVFVDLNIKPNFIYDFPN